MRGYASFRVQICLNDIVEMRKFFEYTSFFFATPRRSGRESIAFYFSGAVYSSTRLTHCNAKKGEKTVATQRSGIARVFFANFSFFTNRENKSSYPLPGYL